MIDISKLSRCYSVRSLEESDVDMILEICEQNAIFYRYTEARPTKGNILDDMKATPPGINLSNKYYFGFFNHQKLIAIMDLIDGYPKPEIAYIGFFMMNPQYQGKQIGTSIISDVVTYLQSMGKTAVRLAIDKGNPQSAHFWKKNGFEVISEADVNGWTKLVAERQLTQRENKEERHGETVKIIRSKETGTRG